MTGKPLVIRAHHLLCMLGFRGFGYSEEFVSNMRRVVNLVARRPEDQILLVDSCDAICSACPHQREGYCAGKPLPVRPEVADEAVLDRIGLKRDSAITDKEAYGRAAAAVAPEDMKSWFCAGCGWLDRGFCTEGLDTLRRTGAFPQAALSTFR